MITLKGRVPSKKNSTLNFVRGGRIIHIPSNDYRKWHKDASLQLQDQKENWPQQTFYTLTVVFYSGDKRKYDLHNKFESIADLLTDNHFIEDDNYEVLPDIRLIYGGYDKGNPRVEIYDTHR